ncbi:MAG TPA: vWA domain-containing protein [bacterium]|nr:vWA domain-containing protein [bacterium]
MFKIFHCVAPSPVATNHPKPPYGHTGKVYGSDKIGLVGFSSTAQVLVQPVDAFSPELYNQSQQLHLHVGGMTNITDAIRQSVGLLSQTPIGMLRRIWLLTDGCPNCETDSLFDWVSRAREAYCNINVIGFGNPDNLREDLLQQIASGTHNGKYMKAATLKELTDVLVLNSGRTAPQRRHHRAETTILAIDLSGSMSEPMQDTTKIAVVEQAILQLLYYKQRVYA